MIGRSTLSRAGAIALVALLPSQLLAQRILGGGGDGVTLPRGAFRVGIGGESTMQRDRWRDGTLEGLAGPMTSDALGPLQFSVLTAVEQLVRDAGVTGFGASLGSSRVDSRQRAFVTPLSVEYGLFDWLTLRARASLVRTRAETQFRLRADSGRATLGINPFFTGTAVAAQNGATVGAYSAASANLLARRNACQANAGAFPECPTILAELGAVDQVIGSTTVLSGYLRDIYGTGSVRGQPFVPFTGSAADSTLRARAESLSVALNRYGVTDVTPTTGIPLGAQVPLAGADLDRLVRDSTDGFGAKRLDDASLTQIGDVFLSALIRVHDSFAGEGRSRFAEDAKGWRQSVLVEARLGTSHREQPDRFLDQGTGSATSAVTVRSVTDLVVNARLWTTLAIGFTKPFAKDFRMRVPSDTGFEWLEWQREMLVPVTPGSEIDVEVSPRWHLNDYVALGAQWRWRSKSADRHEVPPLASTSVNPLPAPTIWLYGRYLDDRSKAEEQRVGLSATYSTLAARARGIPGLTFDVTYLHQQSVASGVGVVPKQWEDRLTIRYYTRFFER